jgi:RimJ/RimL family protein N-acetyltransferase
MIARHEMPTEGAAMLVSQSFRAGVPVLTSDRVTLRAPRLEDFDSYAQIVCTDRGIYVDGPYSREDGWFDFLSLSSGWMLHGHGGWAVEETATGKLAGFVCLGLEPGDREIELGYLFLEWAEGKGFAFEAATKARDYAWDKLKLKTLVSYVDRRNVRSIVLTKRLGGFDDTPTDFPAGSIMFRHLPPEARA